MSNYAKQYIKLQALMERIIGPAHANYTSVCENVNGQSVMACVFTNDCGPKAHNIETTFKHSNKRNDCCETRINWSNRMFLFFLLLSTASYNFVNSNCNHKSETKKKEEKKTHL